MDPEEGPEVLAYGGDRPPRRLPRVLVGGVAGLAVGVALGVVVGDRADTPTQAGTPSEKDRPPTVAAGTVSRTGGSGFRVSLFNAGEENLAVTVVALPGWAPRLTESQKTTIAPRSWGAVRFKAPVDCSTYPAAVRVVHIRIDDPDGVVNRVVPLAEPAEVLRRHHEAACKAD